MRCASHLQVTWLGASSGFIIFFELLDIIRVFTSLSTLFADSSKIAYLYVVDMHAPFMSYTIVRDLGPVLIVHVFHEIE